MVRMRYSSVAVIVSTNKARVTDRALCIANQILCDTYAPGIAPISTDSFLQKRSIERQKTAYTFYSDATAERNLPEHVWNASLD